MNISNLKYKRKVTTVIGNDAESAEMKRLSPNFILNKYIKNINFWIWSFIIFGIIIRLVQYLHNRSLWTDEAMLALNVANRSFFQLLKPLEDNQSAPFGFLAITKAFTILLGNNELSLRLFPLLTGIFSMVLFYFLSKEYLRPIGTLISVALFSIMEPLYYYASEFKPYSSDVFFTIILFLLFTKLKPKGINTSSLILFSLAGIVITWFSFPSVFVLAGIGTVALFYFIKNHDWQSLLRVLLVCTTWLISFFIYYFTSLQSLSHSDYMKEFWKESFMPVASISPGSIKWFIDTFFEVFSYSLKNPLSGLAGLFFIIGLISFHKKFKEVFYVLFLPFIITLLVSGLHLYPFNGRLILFLVPSLVLFISGGLESIELLNKPYKSIFIISVTLIFSLPLYYAIWNLHRPIEKEEIKDTLNYVNKKILPDDEIYIYNGATPAFDFYKNKYGLAKYHTIYGVISRKNWQGYINDLDRLKGKKNVWIVFSHIYDRTNEKEFFLTYLNKIGNMKKSFKAVGAEVYLYDLTTYKI